MPRSGTGNYVLPVTLVDGTTATATQVMQNFNDIATALTASTAADGQTKITGNWNWQSKNLSDVGTLTAAAAAFTDAATTNGMTVGNGLVVTKGGATVSAGGATITGNSTVTGTLTITSTATAANATTGTQVVNWSQFPVTLGTTGAQGLPGGKLEKWGTGSTTLGSGTVTFAAAFPSKCDNVQVTITGGTKASTLAPLFTGNITAAGFNVYGDAAQSLSFHWVAIGQ